MKLSLVFGALSLVVVGCGGEARPLDEDSGSSPMLETSNKADAATESSSSSTLDAGVDHGNSTTHEADAGHDTSTPVRLDAGIDSGKVPPSKDAGVNAEHDAGHDAPHDSGVDSWIAPGSVATGGVCTAQSDCTVGNCDYTGHCTAYMSCTQHHGGDTCGAGEDTDLGPAATPATNEESCCVSIQIPGTSYTVDKYLVTSGRMRAMVTSLNGNLRGFTASIPASNTYWNPAWNAYIPSTLDEVDEQLGPYPAPLTPDPYNPDDRTMDTVDNIFNGLGLGQWRDGCTLGNPLKSGGAPDGARTWWSPNILGGDLAPVAYPQDYLDDKFLNCVDAYMLTAFCIWDGGHLASLDELAAAWGPENFPWSYKSPNVNINETCNHEDSQGDCTDPSFQSPMGVDANGLDMSHYVAHEFGGEIFQFITPFTYSYDPYSLFADNSINMPPPGRFPLGNSKDGIADLVGTTYTITAIIDPDNVVYPPTSIANSEHVGTMAGQGSWEDHPINPGSGTEQKDENFRPAWWAYWAGGGRCAR